MVRVGIGADAHPLSTSSPKTCQVSRQDRATSLFAGEMVIGRVNQEPGRDSVGTDLPA